MNALHWAAHGLYSLKVLKSGILMLSRLPHVASHVINLTGGKTLFPLHLHRLSYTFGLQGPCISTDTACSSSLVSMHLAHKGLLAGDSTAAVAAGVNLLLSSTTTVAICQLQALSPVGRCRSGSPQSELFIWP